MRSDDVLIEVANALERDDFDALSLVDSRHHSVITPVFDGKGPLRILTSATLWRSGLELISLSEKHVAHDVDEFLLRLRNAYVKTFFVECLKRDEATIQRLRDLKNFYVVDELDINACNDSLVKDIFACKALTWGSSYCGPEAHGEADDSGCADVALTQTDRCGYVEDVFQLPAVNNAQSILFGDDVIPFKYAEAACRWLNGGNPTAEPREMVYTCLAYSGSCTEAIDLIDALENQFVRDTESREYSFTLFIEYRNDKWNLEMSKRLVNSLADVFEVDAIADEIGRVTITRRREESFKRFSLVATKEGHKIWDFRSSRGLEKYLLSNSVYELLARSDLIANQMTCECGSPMYFQSRPRRNQNEWRCSGKCRSEDNETIRASPLEGSWLRHFADLWFFCDQYASHIAILLKMIIELTLHESAFIETPHHFYSHMHMRRESLWEKLLAMDAKLVIDDDVLLAEAPEDPLEGYYWAVRSKHPVASPFQISSEN